MTPPNLKIRCWATHGVFPYIFGTCLRPFQAFSSKKDLKSVTTLGNTMLDLLHDLDRILSCDSHFMMGVWIRDAKLMGTTEVVRTSLVLVLSYLNNIMYP